jgi:putative ABC transport system permease protein
MSAVVIGIFMFGLILGRRREYVLLRAQGMQARDVRRLVLGEAALLTTGGLVAGLLAGAASAFLLIQVLRPLFILPPDVTVPASAIAVLVVATVAAALIAAFAALAMLRRVRPTEILRER